MRKLLLIVSLVLGFTVYAQDSAEKQPDLSRLKNSGFIMGPGSASYPVHDSWQRFTRVMQYAATFDKTVKEIEAIVCGPESNKSVLLIGEPNEFFRYVFARMATRPESACSGLWHVDVDIQKIEAGHKYVGEVDEYWRNEILIPSENKSVVLYMSSLSGLIGLGSHSNDDTGIEREYSMNLASGKIRTVAFIDKYNYNDVIRSKHAYVLESFASKIVLPPVDMTQAGELVQSYLGALYPHLKLGPDALNYLLKMGAYYLPNRPEPERSMAIVNKMIRSAGGAKRDVKNISHVIETKHPYDNNSKLTWEVKYPEFKEIQLVFESFDVETNYDKLVITDSKGNVLETLTGSKGAFKTDFYPTNHLILNFTSDNDGNKPGFKITGVGGAKFEEYEFTVSETRNAVMTVAQVPQWMIDKNYQIIKDLKGKLDGDVVGVKEGKEDMVRLAKNGYVAGRTDEKPIATMLLAGPTGTGKSYIAKRFADYTEQKMIAFDMTSYKEPSSFRTFQEVLTRALTNNPYAVYLFEEIDKASVEVLDQLYFMMDEGIFYDPYQRPLFARGAFILMTTNAASDTILANPKSPDLRKLVMDDLNKAFRGSFLNRFDAVTIFMPFTAEEYMQLAKTLIDKKLGLIREFYDWKVSVDKGVYDYVGVKGASAIFGARPMERLVESVIGGGIAEYQLTHEPIPDKSVITITKLPAEHAFRIKIGNKMADFEVNPNNNSGVPPAFRPMTSMSKLQRLFIENRLY